MLGSHGDLAINLNKPLSQPDLGRAVGGGRLTPRRRPQPAEAGEHGLLPQR